MNSANLNLKNIKTYQRKTLPLYTQFILDPISRLIVLMILRLNLKFKPYIYTYFGLVLAIISSFFFLNQEYVLGAIIFQISLIFDIVDGYVAKIQNSGSTYGIISDGVVDFLRVFLNLLGLYLSLNIDFQFINFFTIYFLFTTFENSINSSLRECKDYFKNQNLKLNDFEKKLLVFKSKFENKNLRLIFYYYHERYFLIFFIGPIIGNHSFFIYLAISLSFIFLILKIFLDIALLKN